MADFIAGRGPARRPAATAAAAPAGTSLELSPRPAAPTAPAAPAFVPRRPSPDGATVLTRRRPTVLLNRLQSAIGALRIQGLWPPHSARLGCAFQLHSGRCTVVWPGGVPGRVDPLTLTANGESQTVTLDLLRCRELDRAILVAACDSAVPWTGTLLLTTYGGSRVEVPLDGPPAPGVLVLMSLYNLSGEYVVRAEWEHIAGSMRDAATAYGFDRISWYDGDTAIS
ncbi:hypothetical protein [Spirilliplanes yamanashiensis]|uniref:hypothetical protein n=1 Tax=Spirilliplanes yamanashiensis TaxID=42233 RepID=UPI001950C668|nr:hypothetical protein [Spirilliplanes yamanashiensis]